MYFTNTHVIIVNTHDIHVLTATTLSIVFCPKIVIMRGCDMIFRNVTFTSRIEIFKLWLELFFHQVVSMGGRPSPALEREAVENGGKCEVIID